MHCDNCRKTLAKINHTELMVWLELVRGKTNKEIAQTLAYTARNVKNYVSFLFAKTDTRNRTELTIYALRHHVVELDELDEV